MGCGNSTATSTAKGPSEAAKDETEDLPPEDEKRKNYGGVYVGLPADLSSVTTVQTSSAHKACGIDVAEKDHTSEKQQYGPVSVAILGPDAVTVGVPCRFVCSAQCLPECSYVISIGEWSTEHNELAFTMSKWESSKTVTCTAKNSATGRSSTVRKTLHILEGPVNVSISGPQTLTPGETQRFLCTATCKPFCRYTWVVDGDSIAGSGDEVVITPPADATSGTLICKATNSISGLFVTEIRKLKVPTRSTALPEMEISTTNRPTADQLYGPASLLLLGPDTITIGVPASFLCLAQCSPKCSYTIGLDGQSGEGNELAFVLRQWESVDKTVTCTAKTSATGSSSSISKTVRILEGPVNVSISGPHSLNPGETPVFLCSATCKPSCNYSWVVDGVSVASSGNEVIKVPSAATSGTLICKATNSVSGLFVTAIQHLGVASTKSQDVSSSEKVELSKLLFACVMSVFLVIL